ncbi:MAG: tRNA (N6-threonylcarbamoyladenosine(37)-N6)-methyltransferase TrmO [Pseudomonadota bacterium]
MPGSSTDNRAGEVALGVDPRIDTGLTFIGTIRAPWGPTDCPKNLRIARERGGGARILLRPEYALALQGLSDGQAIQLLYWVDRGQRDLIVQSPAHADGPRGVFALRSPVRPNPIALACVRITKIDGPNLEIDAIDAWDGTPVLDIKPWLATIDVPPDWRGPD